MTFDSNFLNPISPSKLNYYEILEVTPKALSNEIYSAFQRLKKTYSSDDLALYGTFDKNEAKELLQIIDQAYRTLSNPHSRLEYDKTLKENFNNNDSQNLDIKNNSINSSSNFPDGAIPESMDLDNLENQSYEFNPLSSKETANINLPSENNPSTYNDTERRNRENIDFSTTKVSKYNIDPLIEEEIKTQSACDGLFLKMVREYKSITVEQISNELKISRKYLSAIESNDFLSLPAIVYVRGFITQLSNLYEINPEKVTAFYMKTLKEFLSSHKEKR